MILIDIDRDTDQVPAVTVARIDGRPVGSWSGDDTASWVQRDDASPRRSAVRGRSDWQEAVLAAAGGGEGLAVLALREARDELVAAATGVSPREVEVVAGMLRGTIRSRRGWSPVIRVRQQGTDVTGRYRL